MQIVLFAVALLWALVLLSGDVLLVVYLLHHHQRRTAGPAHAHRRPSPAHPRTEESTNPLHRDAA
jgi:hypothetical protein